MPSPVKSFLVIILGCITNFAYAQLSDDSIKTLVIKNIMSYHFRKAPLADLGLAKHARLDGKMFFENYWPDENYQLQVKWEKTDMVYPYPNYTIIHIIKTGFQFKNNATGETFNGQLPSFAHDEDYLIAIHPNRINIKFLSGNFFRSKISQDFKLDKDRPESFIDYLRLSFFNMHPTDIRYKEQRENKLCFVATLEDEKEVIFSVDDIEFDHIDLIFPKTVIE